MKDCVLSTGRFRVEAFDVDGSPMWVEDFPNLIATVGLHSLLDGNLDLDTIVFGLIDGSGTPSYANADTMSSHAGWTELTNYTEANRVPWGPDAAATRAKTNATQAEFSINSTITVAGVFGTTDNTKGGTTGTLWNAGNFTGGDQVLSSGQTLRVTYTVTGPA